MVYRFVRTIGNTQIAGEFRKMLLLVEIMILAWEEWEVEWSYDLIVYFDFFILGMPCVFVVNGICGKNNTHRIRDLHLYTPLQHTPLSAKRLPMCHRVMHWIARHPHMGREGELVVGYILGGTWLGWDWSHCVWVGVLAINADAELIGERLNGMIGLSLNARKFCIICLV